jgi:hypothetical protein
MGRVVADGVRDITGVLRDFIDDAALLVPVWGRMEGIGGAASVTSQLHCIYKLALRPLWTLDGYTL